MDAAHKRRPHAAADRSTSAVVGARRGEQIKPFSSQKYILKGLMSATQRRRLRSFVIKSWPKNDKKKRKRKINQGKIKNLIVPDSEIIRFFFFSNIMDTQIRISTEKS